MAPGAVALEFMWSINLLFYAYSMSSKDIKAKIILLISRFATLENKDFYVQNDYGILAYMCINEVMEYWWLENGQCLQVSKLDPISKSVRLPWLDIEL